MIYGVFVNPSVHVDTCLRLFGIQFVGRLLLLVNRGLGNVTLAENENASRAVGRYNASCSDPAVVRLLFAPWFRHGSTVGKTGFVTACCWPRRPSHRHYPVDESAAAHGECRRTAQHMHPNLRHGFDRAWKVKHSKSATLGRLGSSSWPCRFRSRSHAA